MIHLLLTTSLKHLRPETVTKFRLSRVELREGEAGCSGGGFLGVRLPVRVPVRVPVRLPGLALPLVLMKSLLVMFVQEPQSCLSINRRSAACFISHKTARSLFTVLMGMRKVLLDCMRARTRTCTITSAGPHPPLKNKSDVCVFVRGHVGEAPHASSLVSSSQSQRYSGGRGQRPPRRTIYCPSPEFHMIQVWEWKAGKAGALAALSRLSDKTESAASESSTRSTLAPSHVLAADERTSTNAVISRASKTSESRDAGCRPFFNGQIKPPSLEFENKVAAFVDAESLVSV